MVFQPNYDIAHDRGAHGDHDRSRQQSRLERTFSRRAQKAETYRRILVTTPPRPAMLGHRPG